MKTNFVVSSEESYDPENPPFLRLWPQNYNCVSKYFQIHSVYTVCFVGCQCSVVFRKSTTLTNVKLKTASSRQWTYTTFNIIHDKVQWHNFRFDSPCPPPAENRTLSASCGKILWHVLCRFVAFVAFYGVFPQKSKNVQNKLLLHARKYFKAPRLPLPPESAGPLHCRVGRGSSYTPGGGDTHADARCSLICDLISDLC